MGGSQGVAGPNIAFLCFAGFIALRLQRGEPRAFSEEAPLWNESFCRSY